MSKAAIDHSPKATALTALFSDAKHLDKPHETLYFDHPYSNTPIPANIFVDSALPALGLPRTSRLSAAELDWIVYPDSKRVGITSGNNLIVRFNAHHNVIRCPFSYIAAKQMDDARIQMTGSRKPGRELECTVCRPTAEIITLIL